DSHRHRALITPRADRPKITPGGQRRMPGLFGYRSRCRAFGATVQLPQDRQRLACATAVAAIARSAGQAPRHGLHAAGIAAAGDEAEVAAGLPECLLIDVGLSGRLLDDARLLWATSELLAKEMQRALAALGWLREDRGRGFA